MKLSGKVLDIKIIREKADFVKKNLEKRNNPEKIKILEETIEADRNWRRLKTEINALRQKRNLITKQIVQMKKKNEDISKKLNEAKEIDGEIEEREKELKKLEQKIRTNLLKIPNLLHDSVPYGKDENENVEIRRWGKPPQFDFEPKDHLTILKNLGLIEIERAAKVAGSGFVILKNELVLLDQAIQRFAIDYLVKKGFELIEPPYMVNKKSYEGMIGDPFDFAEASYKIDGEDLFLIPTSEYSLGAMFTNEVFEKSQLPLKLCGVSACFRKEVGTHGKYTKGLFRMHQFNKVEQFVICLPEQSWEIHEELQKNSEELYQKLGLHYRVVLLCSGDTGAKSAKTYDIECWMADGKYRETGSNSNCTDYQARRLNIKWREGPGKPVAGFVHTLNNTALATSRTMIAIIEQFQQKDGTVVIPKVLRPYMNGLERLEKH